MSADGWTFADLEPDQVDLVNEAERTLDTDVVMAYAPSRVGHGRPGHRRRWHAPGRARVEPAGVPAGARAHGRRRARRYRRDVD